MMKTKREVLKVIAKNGTCEGIVCINCPYKYAKHCPITATIKRIGAMAILRMFKEKKKPILDVGTKIKFSDGSIATIFTTKRNLPILVFTDDECRETVTMDYLVGRIWEIVE